MTVWVYDTVDINADLINTATRCDVIIHSWDNSGDLKKKYEIDFKWRQNDQSDYIHFSKIGTATSDGISYDVLRTMPGGYGEGASYNLIPTSWPREFITDFPTDDIQSTIDVNKILKDVIALEEANGVDQRQLADDSWIDVDLITDDWGLNVMEWTVTGQSGAWVHDPAFPDDFSQKVFVPSSMGRFTFQDYFIPNPCSSNPNIDCAPSLANSEIELSNAIEVKRNTETGSTWIYGNLEDYTIKIVNTLGQAMKIILVPAQH